MSAAPDEPRPWDLDGLVDGLRGAREGARGYKPLPSREALAAIVASLRGALFPEHFGPRSLGASGVDYFVGHTLNVTLHALREQVLLELKASPQASAPEDALAARASGIVASFASGLPRVLGLLQRDVQAAFDGDPAAKTRDEILFCYPGITAITHHRLAHELYMLGAPVLARILAELAHSSTGIDIHPGAHVGGSFFIDHGTGVVVGETCSIGDRVRIYQGVTLGAKSIPLDERGSAVKGLPRHPVIEDGVVIYAGATILGPITVGRGSSIGGNVWLTHSVPPGSVVTQALVRREVFDGGAGI